VASHLLKENWKKIVDIMREIKVNTGQAPLVTSLYFSIRFQFSIAAFCKLAMLIVLPLPLRPPPTFKKS